MEAAVVVIFSLVARLFRCVSVESNFLSVRNSIKSRGLSPNTPVVSIASLSSVFHYANLRVIPLSFTPSFEQMIQRFDDSIKSGKNDA